MERKFTRLHCIILFGILLMAFILTGCNGSAQTALTSDTPAVDTTPEIAATNTAVPTQTPQPAKVVLITAGMNESMKADLSSVLMNLASENSLLFEERDEFQASEINPEWRAVVMAAPDAGLPEAVAANLNTQFIVLSDQELTTSANLSVIHLRRDKQAFVAGYLSTVITPDWRTAGLFAPGATGDAAEQAYINGGEYLCGLCNPYYAPLVLFPISARVSGSDDATIWQADLDALLANYLYTVYVSTESESPALWQVLSQSGLTLVGNGNPPEGLIAQWAASVMLDAVSPLQALWPDIMAGQGGKTLETPVKLENINENYLTPGKKLLVDKVMEELAGGWIEPLDIPE